MTNARAQFLIENGLDIPVKELSDFSEEDFIVAQWGEAGYNLVSYIERHKSEFRSMTIDDFLTHCTTCGGNWVGLLITGVQKLYPAVYNRIPDKMGSFAFRCVGDLLVLLNVDCYDCYD